MAVRHLRPASEPLTESQMLRRQLARVESAFYDDPSTSAVALKALSVEMRELRALIQAAEVVEKKTLTVVADTADDSLS